MVLKELMIVFFTNCICVCVAYRCQPPADQRFGAHSTGLCKGGGREHSAARVGGQGMTHSSHSCNASFVVLPYNICKQVEVISFHAPPYFDAVSCGRL